MERSRIWTPQACAAHCTLLWCLYFLRLHSPYILPKCYLCLRLQMQQISITPNERFHLIKVMEPNQNLDSDTGNMWTANSERTACCPSDGTLQAYVPVTHTGVTQAWLSFDMYTIYSKLIMRCILIMRVLFFP